MADNPNKKKADGQKVSKQPHEEAYQERKASAAGNNPKTKAAPKKKSS